MYNQVINFVIVQYLVAYLSSYCEKEINVLGLYELA